MAPIHTSELIDSILNSPSTRPLDGVELSPTLLGRSRLTDQLEAQFETHAEPFISNPEDMDPSCVFF